LAELSEHGAIAVRCSLSNGVVTLTGAGTTKDASGAAVG
jgi:hypothetical protein